MMSSLLFRLLLWVHCHPGVMFRVSLLPVVKVVSSEVSKEPFALILRSFSKPDAVKPAGGGVIEDPDEVNRLSQSIVCVTGGAGGGGLPTVVVVLALTSPSSCIPLLKSWTPSAMPGARSARSIAARTMTTRWLRACPPTVGRLVSFI